MIPTPDHRPAALLHYRLKNEYEAKREEWSGPPKVEEFKGVSGDTTPLHSAAQYGDLAVVQMLISKGQDPNERALGSGITPLLIAARHGQDDVVKWLLTECVPRGDYEMRDNEGNSMHLLAAKNGHTSTIKFFIDLLKNKFDMKESRRWCNIKNNLGMTPLFAAAQNGHLKTVKYLVHIEAGINIGRDDGATPLFVAAYNGHLDVVKCLVEEGRAEIDYARQDGRQPCPGNSAESAPIRAAHRMGNFEIVQYLFGK